MIRPLRLLAVGLALLFAAPWPVAARLRGATRAVMLSSPPRYQQMYISSCEAAATHMALQMSGVLVPEAQLIAELPADRRAPVYDGQGFVVRWGDPYRAFVGDITRGDSWPLVGYGVYAPPILDLLRRHGLDGSYGGSGLNVRDLQAALDAGHPVIAWVPKLALYWYAPTFQRNYWTAWDGQRVPWNRVEHAQVVVGYDASGFYVDNPDAARWSNGQWLWHYSYAEFQRGWDVLGDQAIVVMRRPAPTSTPTNTPSPTRTPTPTVPAATETPAPQATTPATASATPSPSPTVRARRAAQPTPAPLVTVPPLPTPPPLPAATPSPDLGYWLLPRPTPPAPV